MDHQKRLKETLNLEKKLNLNDFVLDGVNYWPFIRSELWVSVEKKSTKSRDSQRDYLNFLKYILKELGSIAQLPLLIFKVILKRESLILFETSQPSKIKVKDGLSYDKEIDPILEYIGKNYSYIKTQTIDWLAKQTRDYYSTLYLPLIFITPYIKYCLSNKTTESKRFISNLKRLKKLCSFKNIDVNQLMTTIFYIDFVRRYYLILLRIIRPKIVFLSCYYRTKHFGLIAACRQLKIKTAEIQHGKQGKYHAMYNHWQNVPKCGYDLIPEYFFLWGKESVNNIKFKSSKVFLKYHKPILVGNFWASRWLNGRYSKLISKEEMDFLKALKKYRKIILITLQPVEVPLPGYLMDSLGSLPSGTFVLFRLHPSMVKNENIYKDLLQKYLNCNFDINNATQVKLYALLPHMDVHMTAFSSVCYEAQLFSKPTIIFSSEGLNLYKKEIKKGIFWYANDSKVLSKLIKKLLCNPQNVKKYDYIETDPEKIKKRIDKFLAVNTI